ncbi:MAG: 50S ribosomal protein L29 [Bacillales bacterium]|jgi:large subunit ribosomal protein L29|nr:50S ribosomal protein L29 [Bacillales bacterium]
MKLEEIRNTNSNELQERVLELKKELFEIRFKRATGKTEGVAKQKSIRKTVARILTVLKEREIRG